MDGRGHRPLLAPALHVAFFRRAAARCCCSGGGSGPSECVGWWDTWTREWDMRVHVAPEPLFQWIRSCIDYFLPGALQRSQHADTCWHCCGGLTACRHPDTCRQCCGGLTARRHPDTCRRCCGGCVKGCDCFAQPYTILCRAWGPDADLYPCLQVDQFVFYRRHTTCASVFASLRAVHVYRGSKSQYKQVPPCLSSSGGRRRAFNVHRAQTSSASRRLAHCCHRPTAVSRSLLCVQSQLPTASVAFVNYAGH